MPRTKAKQENAQPKLPEDLIKNHVHSEDETQCPVVTALNLIGSKWKIVIIYNLMDGMKRFNELQKLLPGITQKMLAMRLRELEKDGIIDRKIYAVVPPKVEYTLTSFGQSLEKMIEQVKSWGLDINNLSKQKKSKNKKSAKKPA